MRNGSGWTLTFVGTVLSLTLFAAAAVAGPPLICHPFAIGRAESLPWSDAADLQPWNAPSSSYDLKRLSQDVVSLLNEKAPVIVRMETIRRAALYAAKDTSAAQELLSRLGNRAEKSARSDALYLFDYGYLIETMKQAWLFRNSPGNDCPAAAINGLAYVQQALQLRGGDPQMEFAAAIVTYSLPKHEGTQGHLQRAIAGASHDPLLAQNLTTHFPDANRLVAKTR